MPTNLTLQMATAPVGGSHFASTFQRRKAFEGYVYTTREREIIPKAEYERKVGRTQSIDRERWQAVAGKVHGEKHKEVPKLTKEHQEDLDFKKSQPLYRFGWQEHFADPNFIVPGNNKTSYKPQWLYKEPKDFIEKPDLTKQKVRPQWFPKEMLDVNLPRVKLYGIDPIYYDNPPEWGIKNTYSSRPPPSKEIPPQTQKWKSQEAWNKLENHGCFKITEKPMNLATKLSVDKPEKRDLSATVL